MNFLVVPYHRYSRPLAVGLLCASCFVGCNKADDVETYTVTREFEQERRQLVFPQGTKHESTAPTPAEPGRLIGVLLPHDGQMWFFKMLGPDEAVKRHVEQVKAFVAAVKFEGNKPVWSAPKEWSEQPGNAMSYATFVVDAALPTIKLVVSEFPGEQDLADNVNRWRGQLKLPPLGAEEARKAAIPLTTAAGPALWVELTGILSASSGMPPFAGGGKVAGPIDPGNGTLPAGHPPVDPAANMPKPAGGPAAAGAEGPVKYELPTGWTPSPPSNFNIAAFSVVEGAEKLRITVSEAQGDLLSNVNRWRVDQLQLPPLDEEQLKTATTKMKVSGLDADVVELIAPAGNGPQRAIFGVIAKKSPTSSYFIKLMGDAPLAQRERERFMKFVASIRFDR
ncbi:MAG: hypothetical protein K8U03_03865 [Planctomycetia bacterium]|nr:hypothetical protein [Planctomycetia bacterium]